MKRVKHISILASIAALILVSFTIITTSTATAQVDDEWTWTEITPSSDTLPPPRRNGTAVYDSAAKRIIIFGGVGPNGLLNDTWSFDLATSLWTQLDTTGTPPEPRRGHNAVYDPIGNQMVLWAGQQSAKFFNDTWTLNLSTLEWRNVTPPSGRPRARYGAAAIYDPLARELVQFAGFTEEGRRFQDTQGFNLNNLNWQDYTPAGTKPQIRCLLTGAYDRTNRRMIIYGGQRSGFLDDLWAFDLRTRQWTDLTTQNRPSGRFHAESFIADDGRFYVFGGLSTSGNVNEVWSFDFDSRQWTRLELGNAPSPRNSMTSAYIAEENRLIVFGGDGFKLFNDLWELRGPEPVIPSPLITDAQIDGKRLVVSGIDFDNGAVILIDGQPQKTKRDKQSPTTSLIAKKGGKRIAPGQIVMIRVMNLDGKLSEEFPFMRPAG